MNRKSFTFPVSQDVLEQIDLASALDHAKDEVIYRNRCQVMPGTEVELTVSNSDGIPLSEASLYQHGRKVHTQIGLCFEGDWTLEHNGHHIDVAVVAAPKA